MMIISTPTLEGLFNKPEAAVAWLRRDYSYQETYFYFSTLQNKKQIGHITVSNGSSFKPVGRFTNIKLKPFWGRI
jgi:hypothetical protein